MDLINAKIRVLLENNPIDLNQQQNYSYHSNEDVNDVLAINLKDNLEEGFGGEDNLTVSVIQIELQAHDEEFDSLDQEKHGDDHAAYNTYFHGDHTSIYFGKYLVSSTTYVLIGIRFNLRRVQRSHIRQSIFATFLTNWNTLTLENPILKDLYFFCKTFA